MIGNEPRQPDHAPFATELDNPCPSATLARSSETNPIVTQGAKVVVWAPAVAEVGYDWSGIPHEAISEESFATPIILIDTAKVPAGQAIVKLKLEGLPRCAERESEVAFRVVPTNLPPQRQKSFIYGVAYDSKRNGLRGAEVTARMVDSQYNKLGKTDEGGRYLIEDLEDGKYNISISLAGFQADPRYGIALNESRFWGNVSFIMSRE